MQSGSVENSSEAFELSDEEEVIKKTENTDHKGDEIEEEEISENEMKIMTPDFEKGLKVSTTNGHSSDHSETSEDIEIHKVETSFDLKKDEAKEVENLSPLKNKNIVDVESVLRTSKFSPKSEPFVPRGSLGEVEDDTGYIMEPYIPLYAEEENTTVEVKQSGKICATHFCRTPCNDHIEYRRSRPEKITKPSESGSTDDKCNHHSGFYHKKHNMDFKRDSFFPRGVRARGKFLSRLFNNYSGNRGGKYPALGRYEYSHPPFNKRSASSYAPYNAKDECDENEVMYNNNINDGYNDTNFSSRKRGNWIGRGRAKQNVKRHDVTESDYLRCDYHYPPNHFKYRGRRSGYRPFGSYRGSSRVYSDPQSSFNQSEELLDSYLSDDQSPERCKPSKSVVKVELELTPVEYTEGENIKDLKDIQHVEVPHRMNENVHESYPPEGEIYRDVSPCFLSPVPEIITQPYVDSLGVMDPPVYSSGPELLHYDGYSETVPTMPAYIISTEHDNSGLSFENQPFEGSEKVLLPEIAIETTGLSHNPSGLPFESLNDSAEFVNTNGADSEGDHVVHFHINPGTTVNFTTSDGSEQKVSGPATVRMVSTNSNPPIALPVQVPPGHVVQQIVDENGTLQHVILSSQMPPMGLCYHGGNGGNTGPPPYYGPPPPPHPNGAPPPGPPQGYVGSYQPQAQYSPVMTPPPLTQQSPPPHNYQKQDRQNRQYDKSKGNNKYYARQQQQHYSRGGSVHNTPPLSPKKEDSTALKNGNKRSDEEVDQKDEFEAQLTSILTQLAPVEIINITPQSVSLQWRAPPLHMLQESAECSNGDLGEVSYEIFLNKQLMATVSEQLYTTVENLKPGCEYTVQLCCICGVYRGSMCGEQVIRTLTTIPEQPNCPRLTNKTKQSLHIKWVSPKDGGSRITSYILELMDCGAEATALQAVKRAQACAEGRIEGKGWREVYRGRGREFTLNKLAAATGYRIRLAALNSVGVSRWSVELICSTSGLPPHQPAAPRLAGASVTSLALAWDRESHDHSYNLKMEDPAAGYGFLPVYRGTNNEHNCTKLKRNSDYKFRLSAVNDEGESLFSSIVSYRTLPDCPSHPSPPMVKGKTHPYSLRLHWSRPADTGGSPILHYVLAMDKGKGFESVYQGVDSECDCGSLQPGTTYSVRCQAVSAGGESAWSPISKVSTDPVVPHQCPPPSLAGKARANVLQLKWSAPPNDGGSPILSYNVEMVTPDSDRKSVYSGREGHCAVASLLPGRPYIFLVRALNRVGAGPWSEVLETLSGAGPPETPKAPQLACRGPNVIAAQWDEPINNGAKVDNYTIQIAEVHLSHPESSESSSTCGDSDELTFSNHTSSKSTHTDLEHLLPDTTYAVRVCAVNAAGSGSFSPYSTVSTPPSCPAPPLHLSASDITCNTLLLRWSEPKCNGDAILHYNVEVVDSDLSSTTHLLETEVDQLVADTDYRLRVQAVNGVGVGPWSHPLKVQTRALPPSPPVLELVKSSHNYLKVSWGDKKHSVLTPEHVTYCLQMECTNSNRREFQQVYNGPANSYKLTKLSEATTYKLRINASNADGTGAFSDVTEFRTLRAPPPAPKTPRQSEVDGGVLVEWCSVRCYNDDPVEYCLQTRLTAREHDFTTVYSGSDTRVILSNLLPGSLYNIRVSAVRKCPNGEELTGPHSSPLTFNSPKAVVQSKPVQAVTTTQQQPKSLSEKFSWRRLSDSEKAVVIFSVMSVFAVVFANLLYLAFYG